jgi:hypothetical protein
VNEHRAVRVLENVSSDFDDTVRVDPDQASVERRMMEIAECDSVADGRSPERIRVGHDMGGLKQFIALQPADGTVVLVRPHHPFPEVRLM